MELNTNQIINENEQAFLRAIDIADRLGISESTVRKYSQFLIKAGYKFEVDISGARVFRLADERAFYEVIRLKKEAGMSLAMATKMVAAQQGENSDRPMSEEVIQATRQQMEIRAFQEMQNKFLNEVAIMKQEILEEIQSKLPVKEIESPKLLAENEHLKNELESLKKESLEKDLQIEELSKQNKESPKGFFRRLFK